MLVITLILKYCHTRHFSKLLTRVNVTHIFATLLLLAYSNMIRTCIDLISATYIDVYNTRLIKWRVDPDQDYFSGLHIFGFFLAVLFLVILVPLPFLLLFPTQSLRLPLVKRMKPLFDAFTAPLAGGRQFWVGFRMLTRVLFYLLLLAEEKSRNITISILIIMVTILQAYLKPFKTTAQNLFDLHIMVNLTMVFLQAVIPDLGDEIARAAVQTAAIFFAILVTEAVVLFVVYIVAAFPCTKKLASYIKIKCRSLFQKNESKKHKDKKMLESTPTTNVFSLERLHTHSHVHVHSHVGFREPLFDHLPLSDDPQL